MRKLLALAVLVTMFGAPPSVSAESPTQDKPAVMCDIGPVQKTYGGTDWVVYSCPDQLTVIIYSAANNPGKEFYFMFYRKDGELHLYGEGNGDKKYTDAAFKELEPMTSQDVDDLVKETRLATHGE